ncbi:MAG: RIP metalloprotease RseP [Candidatus Syntrophosphaera sp.]
MTLIYTLLAFGIMIFIHELGHFLVARAFGVGIEKFSIGFGKPIKEWKRKGVVWRLGWIPLGGYVKMKGENPDEAGEGGDGAFQKKPWWQKVLIGLSGPFANLLLGLLLFIVSFMLPIQMEDQRPVIQRAEGKWADVFSPGDSLVSMNGKPIKGYGDFLENLLIDGGGTAVLQRDSVTVSIPVSGAEAESLAMSVYPVAEARIGEVVPKTPAYLADLKPGDLITKVDSVEVGDWYAMREKVINSPDDSVLLTIERDSEEFTRSVKLESSLATGAERAIGIIQAQPVRYTQRFDPLEALELGTHNTASFITTNYRMLFELVKRPSELGRSVGGPVMIVTLGQQIARKGFGRLLLFFGSISLILMIMNLLPIPILDGGLILFAIIEGVIRRPIPANIQSILQSIGFFILLTIMFFAFYGDISSLVLRSIVR